MLFLEIFLTITAWQRGFRAWAIIPVVSAIGIGYLIGMSSPQSSMDSSIWDYVWIDILAIVALIIMVAVGPQKTEEPTEDSGIESMETESMDLNSGQ